MADQYDILAATLGIPLNKRDAWRAMTGAPPAAPAAPAPPTPSYEGASLQDFMPKPAAPAGPPPPPAPSYEGATLGNVQPTPGVSLASPPKGVPGKVTVPMQTADNLQSAPAQLSPSAMRQVNQVANASEATQKNVKKGLEADENRKNLEGATFADDGQAPPIDGSLAGKAIVLPGGRQPASWQVQEGMDLGPDADLAHAQAPIHAREAARLEFGAGQKAAEFERGYLERFNKAAENYALQENSRAEQFQRDYDEHMNALDELRGQIREAKVSPFGGIPSGVSKLADAVAIGLGAFASKHGENAGLEAVKHRINTNMIEQEQQLAKLERGAKGEMNFLGMLKLQFGDIGQAKAAARISYIEAAKSELAKKLGSPDVADPRLLAAYERIRAGLDDDLVRAEAQYRGITRDRTVRHDVNAPPRVIGGVGDGLTHQQEKNVGEMTDALVKSGIPGMREDVNRLLSNIPKEGDIPGIGGAYNVVPDKVGDAYSNWLGSKQGQEIRQGAAVLFNRQLKDESGSAVSDQELERQKAAFYGAKDAASARRTLTAYLNRLNSLEATIRSRADAHVNDVQRQRQAGERGKLDRKSGFSGPKSE